MTRADLMVTRWGARFMGRRFPCGLGRGGITAHKREGDGATPQGRHGFAGVLYRPDRRGRPCAGARPIGPRDLWCDDPRTPEYNQPVHAPFAHGHERLRRADRLYDLVILTDWNWPDAQPGRGSAIFVHRWRKPRHPTEGCIAFRPDHLRWIVARLTPRSRLIIR